jgi:hypothetical protein
LPGFVDTAERTRAAFGLRNGAWSVVAAGKDGAVARAAPFVAIEFPLSVLWPD